MSATFITLIAKKKGAVCIKDFHLISLVGCLYKLLAKTLAIRLKSSLRSVISVSQNAFLPGKQITDCSLMVNEIVNAMRRENWDGLIYKIGMEKAYDHVNWGYLDWVLRKMGFGSKWRNWIKICISSPIFLSASDWNSKGFFKESRGSGKVILFLPTCSL